MGTPVRLLLRGAPLLLAVEIALAALLAPPPGYTSRGTGDLDALARAVAPKYDPAIVTPLLRTLWVAGTSDAVAELANGLRRGSIPPWGDHDLVHAIGMASLIRYGDDPAEALRQCGEEYAWGCYHGVMMAQVTSGRGFDAAALVAACRADFPPSRQEVATTCEHGIGHALAAHHRSDLGALMRACDTLPERERYGCWDGGLMENTTLAKEGKLPGYIRPEDPLYPCNVLAERVLDVCYLGQGRVIYDLAGKSVAAAGELCARVPERYRRWCLQGIGREVDAQANADRGLIHERCGEARGPVRDDCVLGTLKLERDHPLRPEVAPLCAEMTSDPSKRDCYRLLGVRLRIEVPSREERTAECRASTEPAYVSVCLREVGGA